MTAEICPPNQTPADAVREAALAGVDALLIAVQGAAEDAADAGAEIAKLNAYIREIDGDLGHAMSERDQARRQREDLRRLLASALDARAAQAGAATALRAEVERLHAVAQGHECAWWQMHATATSYRQERDKAVAENQLLRAALRDPDAINWGDEAPECCIYPGKRDADCGSCGGKAPAHGG